MAKKPKPTTTVAPTQHPAHAGTVTPFDLLPDTAILRCAELVRSKENPSAPLPCSKGSLWRWVRNGSFPKPVKISERVTGWRAGAVRGWLATRQAGG